MGGFIMDRTLGNYMTCKEAAKELGRSYNTILNWIAKRRFSDVVIDSTFTRHPAYYISRDEIKEIKDWIDNGEKRFHRIVRQNVIEEAITEQPCLDLEELDQQMDALRSQLSDLYQLTKQIQITYLNLYSEVQRLGE